MNPNIPELTSPRTYSSLFTKKHSKGRLGVFNLHFYRENNKKNAIERKHMLSAMKRHNDRIEWKKKPSFSAKEVTLQIADTKEGLATAKKHKLKNPKLTFKK